MTSKMALDIKNLDEILKLPKGQQTPEALAELEKIRKAQWDIFNNKELETKIRNEALDVIAKIHTYLSMKDVSQYKLREKGKGSWKPITIKEREDNTAAFLKFCVTNAIDPTSQALALVWGSTR